MVVLYRINLDLVRKLKAMKKSRELGFLVSEAAPAMMKTTPPARATLPFCSGCSDIQVVHFIPTVATMMEMNDSKMEDTIRPRAPCTISGDTRFIQIRAVGSVFIQRATPRRLKQSKSRTENWKIFSFVTDDLEDLCQALSYSSIVSMIYTTRTTTSSIL